MTQKRATWRVILGIVPMPMLALGASYGVYEFGRLFMPWYFALIGAMAFEAVYVGLAVQRLRSNKARERARNISRGAVVVSVLYVAVAGYATRNPGALINIPWYSEVALALLHATPLATLNYLVAQLLLHEDEEIDALESVNVDTFQPRIRTMPASMMTRRALPASSGATLRLQPATNIAQVDEWIAWHANGKGISYGDISKQLGGTPSRQYIGNCCKQRRAQLAALTVEASE